MKQFCQDRDLLALEPTVFLGGGFLTQQLAAGSNGVFAGTAFTSAGSSFVSAGVAPGMVLTAYATTAAEGSAFEIVSVVSPTALTISVLRADGSQPPVAPTAGGASFHIRTFGPQIQSVSATLQRRLEMLAELLGAPQAGFADSSQLRSTVACGVLASVYLARAQNAASEDANWLKAERYRQEFISLQSQLQVSADFNGDGRPDQVRSLGNVILRRA